MDGDSALVWTDAGSCTVRKLDLSSAWVSTIAGTPRGCGYANGPALVSRFGATTGVTGMQGIAVYGNDVFVADTSKCFSFQTI